MEERLIIEKAKILLFYFGYCARTDGQLSIGERGDKSIRKISKENQTISKKVHHYKIVG